MKDGGDAARIEEEAVAGDTRKFQLLPCMAVQAAGLEQADVLQVRGNIVSDGSYKSDGLWGGLFGQQSIETDKGTPVRSAARRLRVA